MKKKTFNAPWTALGGISPEEFLGKYWQKKPLLVRQAFPQMKDLLSPDELAGLALEPDIRARLVFEKGAKPWRVKKGPFQEQDFKKLPKTHWSLLVSRVNEYLDSGARLLETFQFIPHWRLDDLMVSFAPPGGSVGPHVDSYDVFLVQGLGKRRWQIQKNYDPSLVEGADLRVLKNFKPSHSWDLETGDMLYLPPGIAHYGVALENCMTYSIGMRAPSHRDLLAGLFQTPTDWFSKSLVEYQDEDRLYRDPRRKPTREPGLIDPDVIASITQLALQQIKDSDFMARFTLKHLTLSAQAPEGFSKPTTAALARLMAQLKNPTTRLIRTHIMPLAYVPLHTNTLALGIGGTLIELPLKLQSLLAKITQSSALSGPELLEMVPKPLDSSLGRTGIDLVYNLIQWRILEVSRMKQKD